VAVYCGSSAGKDPAFARGARDLAGVLLRKGLGVVYGGGNVGLMGILADEMLKGGGEIVGVIPQGLAHREIAHEGLTELRVVGSMHERKLLMAEMADGFIALPGGTGTLEELLEALTWTKLGIHAKPVGVLNVGGFYDPLDDLLNSLVRHGFLKEEHQRLLVMERDPATLVENLAGMEEDLRSYRF